MAQITDEQRQALINWASQISAIDALWLFGSRSRNEGRPDSDYDIAIELAPATAPDDDPAFTAYCFENEEWKAAIIAILRSDVSLVACRPSWTHVKFDPRVFELWRR